MTPRTTRRARALAAALLALALAPAARAGETPAPGTAAAEPRLAFAAPALDLGTVILGTRASGAIGIENRTGVDARHIAVRSAYPSLQVTVTPATIPAGGRAEVRLACAARAFTGALQRIDPESGAPTLGDPVTEIRPVLVFACGSEVVDVALPVRASLDALVEARPWELELGSVLAGDAVERTVVLNPCAAPEAEVAGIDAPAGVSVAAAGTEIVMGRRSPKLRVVVTAPRRIGPLEAEIGVRFTDSRLPALRLPITAAVRSDVVVSPARLDLGARVAGSGAEPPTVAVYSDAGRPLRVLAVETDGPVTAGIARIDETRTEVRPGIRPEAAGRVAGRIRVFVDRPEEPVVVVEVTGEQRPPLEVRPGAAFLDLGGGAGAREAVLEVAGAPGAAFEVLGVSTDLGFLEAASGGAGGRRVTLRFRTGAEVPREFRGVLRVRTSHPARPEVQVPVFGRGST